MTIFPIIIALNLVVTPPQDGQDCEVIMDNDTPPLVVVVNQDQVEELAPTTDTVD